MSDMPDRMWARKDAGHATWRGRWMDAQFPDATPYLRSTPAREAADRLATRIEELEAVLPEAAEGLEALANLEYGDEALRGQYPHLQAKWERDMELPRRIRALLNKEKKDE